MRNMADESITDCEKKLLQALVNTWSWGARYKDPDILKRAANLTNKDFNKAIKKLRNKRLVFVHHKPNGDIPSLNPHAKKEIMKIIEEMEEEEENNS